MSDLQSVHILLVEDNAHMRTIVNTILKGAGVRKIRETKDGAEALDVMRQWTPDIALVDYNMYPLDGLDFTRMVRTAADSPNPYLPIIMMTGHSERSKVIEARDAGVNEFVVKPLTARALLDRITAVIMRPRPFVRSTSYFGPDRRRINDPNYHGPLRRASDPDHSL